MILNPENYCISCRHSYLFKLLSNHYATLRTKHLGNISNSKGWGLTLVVYKNNPGGNYCTKKIIETKGVVFCIQKGLISNKCSRWKLHRADIEGCDVTKSWIDTQHLVTDSSSDIILRYNNFFLKKYWKYFLSSLNHILVLLFF